MPSYFFFYLGVLPREETLLKAAIHGEWDESEEPPVLQEPECGQKGVTERLPVLTKLADLRLVNVVQEHGHDEYGQHTHTCQDTDQTERGHPCNRS